MLWFVCGIPILRLIFIGLYRLKHGKSVGIQTADGILEVNIWKMRNGNNGSEQWMSEYLGWLLLFNEAADGTWIYFINIDQSINCFSKSSPSSFFCPLVCSFLDRRWQKFLNSNIWYVPFQWEKLYIYRLIYPLMWRRLHVYRIKNLN